MNKRQGRAGRHDVLWAAVFSAVAFAGSLLLPLSAGGGAYLDSAHGNSTYGVKRAIPSTGGDFTTFDLNFGFAVGNCIHCHEEHASIGGSEPEPNTPAGPDLHMLFAKGFDSLAPADDFCLKCHMGSGSYQAGTMTNRSYSYRAGGWTADTVATVKDSFALSSAHDLNDLLNFIKTRWNYTQDSNPCSACHNVHKAQRDHNASTGLKRNDSRGWLLSRPSSHDSNILWGLWGDTAGERMNVNGFYQAPYRFNGAASNLREPDGSTVTDGSNLTDFVQFCMDCHQLAVTSTPLSRNIPAMSWAAEKHGSQGSDVAASLRAPYAGTGQVLSCMDCHESHGSSNKMILRPEVNGTVLSGTIANSVTVPPAAGCQSSTNKEMAALCIKCHYDDATFPGSPGCGSNKYYIIHHDPLSTDPPYDATNPASCATCHTVSGTPGSMGCNSDWNPINCSCCHYHGGSVNNATNLPAVRTTF